MKTTTSIILLLLFCFTAYGQGVCKTEQKSDEVKIYFDHDSHVVNVDLKQNKNSLAYFSDLFEKLNLDPLSVITKIEINSYASPEGGRTYNKKLAERRSNSIYDYITNTIAVPDSLIEKKYAGADWDGLQELVEASDMQYRDEVLYILKNIPEETWRRVNPSDRWLTMVDSRNKHLMDLKYGNPYRYMFANIYPKLRNGSVVTIYFTKNIEPIIDPEEEIKIEDSIEAEPEQKQKIEVSPLVGVTPMSAVKPLFALKTNLLYDVASLINVEVEVPIGQRWSVAGEWIFPWWTSCGNRNNSWQSGAESGRNTLELLNGNIEGKYWLGDRTNRPVMTGWHLGLYAGGGKYDLERKTKGYQGEFFIAAGLNGGYAHTILEKWVPSGDLRMEYSLGIGYLQTDYRYYEEHWGIDNTWHTIRQNSGTYSWFGPTRARISLVWLLTTKKRGGGVQ